MQQTPTKNFHSAGQSGRRTIVRLWRTSELLFNQAGCLGGCSTETLRKWVRREERDTGQRAGPTSDQLARLKELERENRELRQANEILRKASAFLPRRRSTAL